MLKFWQKPAMMPLSEKMKLHLADERGLGNQAAVSLRMMEQKGRYSGRKVTYFRIFDPATTAAAGIEVRCYDDLNIRAILHSGHLESDGQIMMNRGS